MFDIPGISLDGVTPGGNSGEVTCGVMFCKLEKDDKALRYQEGVNFKITF